MSETYVEKTRISESNLWKKAHGRKGPTSFWLEITARCNNNCRHCYTNIPEGDPKALNTEITFDEIKKAADEAVSFGCLMCIITGGEPFLRDDFSDIYLYLKRKGLLITIFTNATLVNEDLINLLRNYPPWDIQVTVYGVTKETYEGVTRNKGSFDAFMRGLNLLIESEVNIRLRAMVLRSNVNEIFDIARFCREKTGLPLHFDPFLSLRADGDIKRNEEIKSERLLSEEIVELEKYDPELLRIQEKICNRRIAIPKNQKENNDAFQCGAGRWSFMIDSSAHLRPCPSLSHQDIIYDFRKGDVFDAWNNFFPRTKETQSTRMSSLEKCCNCRLIDLCDFCPAHVYLETGDLESTRNYFCEIAHERAIFRGRDPLLAKDLN